jgi:cytochrome o ubiquinol oxidase operon protein cyoD
MHTELSLKQMKKEWHGNLRSYVIGFAASLILTSISFLLVIFKVLENQSLAYTLGGLALLQALFQLIYFLHVGQEAKPKWETLIFCFMFFILLIIVIGSLWIMYDLNERMMLPMTELMPHD